MEKPTQEEHDKLADIVWWIKGSLMTNGECPFKQSHADALSTFMTNWQHDNRDKK